MEENNITKNNENFLSRLENTVMGNPNLDIASLTNAELEKLLRKKIQNFALCLFEVYDVQARLGSHPEFIAHDLGLLTAKALSENWKEGNVPELHPE